MALIVALAMGTSLNSILKEIVDRVRLPIENPLAGFTGYSFPSGHVMAAILLYGWRCTRCRISTGRGAVFSQSLATGTGWKAHESGVRKNPALTKTQVRREL